ncbi:MAG TPA: aminotransferase class I/II-fold pyridoxal phosphate-dependent enzyme, partial [Polyangiales bacterium]
IGWMLAPRAVADACDTIQSQSTTNPATFAQYGALAALTGPDAPVEVMRRAFEARRRLVLAGLEAIPELRCRAPEGAFYAFFDVRAYLGRRLEGQAVEGDVALAELLLDRTHCAFVPGSAFCAPGYLRMSYAASEAQLAEGLGRLGRFLGSLA